MKVNTSLSFYYAVGLILLAYLIVVVVLKLLIRTKLYRGHFLTYRKAINLLERFIGYQSRDTEASREDSELAH